MITDADKRAATRIHDVAAEGYYIDEGVAAQIIAEEMQPERLMSEQLLHYLKEAYPYVRRAWHSDDMGPRSLPTRIFEYLKQAKEAKI